MKYPFYSGLSGKTAIIFLAAFLAIILPVNLIVYTKVKATVTRADTQQMLAEAEKLSSQTRLDPIIVPLPPTGSTVAIRHYRDGRFEPIFESPDFPTIESSWMLNQTFDLDTLKVLVQKLEQPDGSELWFILARSNRAVQEQLAELKLYLFYVTGIVVLVVALLVFALSGFMLRPLKKLAASASEVQASENMQRLPLPKTKDETRILTLALNDMIGRIETSISQQIKFFDSATHELKTPLSILRAELSKAFDSIQDAKTKEWISSLLQDVERLERTISDFLLVSQLKQRTLTIRREPASLPEIVFLVLKKLKKLMDEKQLKVSVQQAANAGKPFPFDADKVQTVIFNLIENAVRYSAEGKIISINLQSGFGYNQLKVSNSIVDSIKNPEQLGNERFIESTRGMGLGLWICRQLIELHEGKLNISVEGDNFLVELTLREDF